MWENSHPEASANSPSSTPRQRQIKLKAAFSLGRYVPCRPIYHTGGAHEAEPLEHRSGVGGVPYFNLIEYMDEAVLAAEIVSSLRDEWLPAYPRDGPFLPGLDAALAAAAARAPMAAGAAGAAGEALTVVVTFANLGYADFVLNGFARAAVPNTLVVALDALAHAAFREAGLVSFFDERMPTIGAEQQDHRSAGFMDMMKLRLLYAAEVLLRGYSLLLTDADAVFVGSPFSVFAPQAALSVACDSTVVPKTWREAPGMVMAGFFFARAGVRPIIFLKEVLDYQARHPEQHDQQSFNQILSELLVADLSVSVMHPRLFPNGFQYFVKRTVQREGGAPLVVQNNWMMGADNKRHRFREAQLWKLDPPAYYGADPAAPPLRLLRYSAEQPGVSGLLRETSALRSALRLATLLNRTLVLPTFCGFTSASGLVPPPPLQYRDTLGAINRDVLDDTVDGDWCTAEWYYDMQAMAAEWGGAYRESSFLTHPQVPPAVLDTRGAPPFFIEAAASWRLVPPPEGATVLRPARLEAGPTDAELLAWLAPHAEVPMLVFGDMAGRFDPLARPLGPAGSSGSGGGDDDSPAAAALTARLERGVVFREEILRHVRQQVRVAEPFDCICVQHEEVLLPQNLTGVVAHFAAAVPRERTVFVAGYRADLWGLDEFRAVWENVYALALYDWNAVGLQGKQFSSVINRLTCQHAARVHSWVWRVEETRECW